MRVAAVRELFEETGLLLTPGKSGATCSAVTVPNAEAARRQVVRSALRAREFTDYQFACMHAGIHSVPRRVHRLEDCAAVRGARAMGSLVRSVRARLGRTER